MRDPFATLAAALLEGPFEQPLWHGFLERLREATGADNVTLTFHPPEWKQVEALTQLNGPGTAQNAQESFERFNYPDNLRRRQWMQDGRAYTLKELRREEGAANPDFFDYIDNEIGITAALHMRVQEPGGVDAWIAAVRIGGKFADSVRRLLEDLAPILRGVLRNYLAREQDRFAAEMAEDAVRRLQFGWIALDAYGAVLSTDRFGEHVLATSPVLARDRDGRLKVRRADLQREIDLAVAKMAGEPQTRPRAIPLNADPWLDMLLIPARHRPLAAGGATSVIAYVHGDNWSSSDRHSQLAELFSLSPSESRLALALCRGKSIAEAAGVLGLTVETARSYSKQIYAKTGARGQPDLVRIVMGSILALSPEA